MGLEARVRAGGEIQADGVISVLIAGETRTNRIALAGTAPQPPRSLSRVVRPLNGRRMHNNPVRNLSMQLGGLKP